MQDPALNQAEQKRSEQGNPSRQRRANFCIDCQSHLYVPEFLAYLENRRTPPLAYRRNGHRFVIVGEWPLMLRPNHTSVEAKLEMMDAAGIDVTVLTTNYPGPEWFGADGLAIARLMNDYIADVVRSHPDRFVGLAVLPTQDTDAAVEELDRSIQTLKLKGWMLFSNLCGEFPDDPRYRPLFRRAEELQIPVLLHPTHPVTYDATKGYDMPGGLGFMFDTTIALTRLILAGIFEEYPDLRLLCPHVGGALPYLIGHIDHEVLRQGVDTTHLRKLPSEYLRNIYLDTVSPLALAIRYAYDFVGPDRLLFASDHPWVEPELVLEEIRRLDLPPEDLRKILHENATKLFNLA
jgi:predicted TIM-barrel fold metal-dependent hydrolase